MKHFLVVFVRAGEQEECGFVIETTDATKAAKACAAKFPNCKVLRVHRAHPIH